MEKKVIIVWITSIILVTSGMALLVTGEYHNFNVRSNSTENYELFLAESPDSNGDPGDPGGHYIGKWTTSFTGPYGDNTPVYVYFPALENGDPDLSEAPYPALVFGHGFQMAPADEWFESYGIHFASWGYVIAMPDFQYAGSTNSDHAKCAREYLATYDFIVEQNETSGSVIEGLLNEDIMGGSGFSLGAKVSILAAQDEVELGINSIKALGPIAMADNNDPSTFPRLDLIDIPIFLKSGTEDEIAPYEENSQVVYDGVDEVPAHFTLVNGANHNQFADQTRGGGMGDGTATISREEQQYITVRYLTSFFNYYLKGEMEYYTYLYGEEAESDLEDEVLIFNLYKNILLPVFPETPTDPLPQDGSIDVSVNPTLSALVSHPESKAMDVEFYDAYDDTLIGTDNGVNSGERGYFQWTGLGMGESYEWYAVAKSGGVTNTSQTWSFTTFELEGPTISLTRPQGGETWSSGTQEDITWTTTSGDGIITGIDIDYSSDGGGSWNNVVTDTSDTGQYTWEIPDVTTDTALARITVYDDNDLSDSDMSGQFTILGAPPSPPENLVVEHHGFGPGIIFSDDVEGGDLGYTTGTSESLASEWGIRQHGASSGVNSWDFGDGQYYKTSSYGYLSWLISPEIVVPVEAEAVELSFSHWRDFGMQTTYLDGGNVKISTNGADYTLITPNEGYDGTINNDYGNPLGGQQAWGGTAGWEIVTFDLTAYAGQSINLRWDVGIEAYDEDFGAGWRLDDMIIQAEGVGGGTEHNLITWDASPDEPDKVVAYNLYRSEYSSGPWDETTLIVNIPADGSADYGYIDENKGEADEIYWWYVVRAVDALGQECGNSDAVREPGEDTVTFDIPLYADGDADGWNLVSFNLLPVDTSLEAILADIDGSYDRAMYYHAAMDEWLSHVPGRGEYFNNLPTWDHTMGVWIRMSVSDTLTVEGYLPTSTDITLRPGWNMVGLPSSASGNHGLPNEVDSIGYFHASADYNLAYDHNPGAFVFEPGKGYWVRNPTDTAITWTVNY